MAARAACAERGDPAGCALNGVTTQTLAADLKLDRAEFQVGPDALDKIVVSRVSSTRGARDIHHAIFLVHGSGVAFYPQFVTKTGSTEDRGIAMWLADKGVDVWGIDLRWATIPAGTADLGPARDWGMQADVDDIRLALRFARTVRFLHDEGLGQLTLAGFSYGASLAYAVASTEAALPAEDRDVKALIPVDTPFKLLPEHSAVQAAWCRQANALTNQLALGIIASNNSRNIDVGRRAQTTPSDVSPYNAAMTNSQYALANVCGKGLAGIPTFHRLACARDASGFPQPVYSSPAAAFALLASNAPYKTIAGTRDYFAVPCGVRNYAFTDHLGDVMIPVLYIGMAGGVGTAGVDTLSFIGSTDKSSFLVRLLPEGSEADDFGHVDSFVAGNANDLVWSPLYAWLEAH